MKNIKNYFELSSKNILNLTKHEDAIFKVSEAILKCKKDKKN